MSSYYKKINGKNYDRAMLDIAEGSVQGKGDGRISLADARSMIKLIKDGGKITDIESRSLNYILENYKLTETALKHIEKTLSENLAPEIKKAARAEKAEVVHEEIAQISKQPAPEKSSKKIFVIFILLLLAIFAVFAIIKNFYKNSKTESAVSEKKDQTPVAPATETAGTKTETTTASGTTGTVPDVKKAEPVQVKPLAENEYLVKEKDTLIKISEAEYGDYKKWEEIYKLNKGKISNPTILYPGQILILPGKEVKK
jgi:nucleoid-associated protein YgaU